MKKQVALNVLKNAILQNNQVESQWYDKLDVKRGLRNKDGTGVITGLTLISSVVGTQTVDGTPHPIHGVLKYRGIPIEKIMESLGSDRFAYEKTAFLLLTGQFPSTSELEAFTMELADQRQLPSYILEHCIKGVPSGNLMNKLQIAVSALYSDDPDPDSTDPLDNVNKSLSIIAKLPLIVVYSYLQSAKKHPKFVAPLSNMSLAESFLYMLREGKKPSPEEVHVLDACLVLHQEHGGGNNSTFAARVVTSTKSDIYSTMAAAMGSLKGPLHGWANKEVMDMMHDIKKNVRNWENKEELTQYLIKILKKEAHDKSGKIYGLGHAVYTKSDPRAQFLKEWAGQFAKAKNRERELQLYLTIESEGPRLFNDIKKNQKIIAPNVDFFSGFVYECLGLPEELFTPLFAIARTVGWSAHRIEELLSGNPIMRPSYKYVGK